MAIGEPMIDRNQILQLLGGLGADYNSIVASLTTREDEISLHSIHRKIKYYLYSKSSKI